MWCVRMPLEITLDNLPSVPAGETEAQRLEVNLSPFSGTQQVTLSLWLEARLFLSLVLALSVLWSKVASCSP